MKTLSGWPVRHPVAAFVVLAALSIVGLALAPWLAPQRLAPTYDTGLRIDVELPGIDPEQIERAVVVPLEQRLLSLPAVQRMSSRSGHGFAEIKLTFKSGLARDAAIEETRSRVTTVRLPSESRPTVERDEPVSVPAVIYAITAASPSAEVTQWIERSLRRPLQEMSDAASVQLDGVEQTEIRVQPDLRRMASLGLSFDDLIQSLRGREEAPRRRGARTAVAGVASVAAIAARAVHLPSGESISLGEVAEVSLSHKPAASHPRYKDNAAVLLQVFPRAARHAPTLAERANAHIAWLRANDQVPQAVQVHAVFDESVETRQWRRKLLRHIGVCIVVAFAAVSFLYGLSHGLVVLALFAVWLPLAAAALWACRFTLNDMTALGLIAACVPLIVTRLYSFTRRTLIATAITVTVLLAALSAGFPVWRQISAAFFIGSVVGVGVWWLLSPWPLSRRKPAGFVRWLPASRRNAIGAGATALLVAVSIVIAVVLPQSSTGPHTTVTARVWGPELRQVMDAAQHMVSALQASAAQDIQSTTAVSGQSRLHLDTEAMQLHELTLAQIGRAFTIAQEGLVIGDGLDGDTRLPLRLQLEPGVAGNAYERLLLRGEQKNQHAVYFRDVGVVLRLNAPRERMRIQQLPAAQVRARLPSSAAVSTLSDLRPKIPLPAGYAMEWSAESTP